MDIDAYLERLDAAQTPGAAFAALSDVIAEEGAIGYSAHDLPFGLTPAPTTWRPLHSTLPSMICAAWSMTGAPDEDPVIAATIASGAPIVFSEIRDGLVLSDAYAAFINHGRACGVVDVVAMPVMTGPGVGAFFAVAFSGPAPRSRIRLRRLQLVCTEAYQRVTELGTQDFAAKLTRRERDVMSGIIRGHSATRIAADLGLSAHTVETYLRRSYDKLGVTNKFAAAMYYMGLGHIVDGGAEPAGA